MLEDLHIVQPAVGSQPRFPPTQIHSQNTFPPNANGSCHQRSKDTGYKNLPTDTTRQQTLNKAEGRRTSKIYI